MPNKISVATLTAICAIAPDNPQLWNVSEDGSSPECWYSRDRHAKKLAFLSQLVGFQLTDDYQLLRAAALCREHVLRQFPIFSEVINSSEACWNKCMSIIGILGTEINLEPLPQGVYKPLAGFQEHQFRHCVNIEEVLALNEKLTSEGG